MTAERTLREQLPESLHAQAVINPVLRNCLSLHELQGSSYEDMLKDAVVLLGTQYVALQSNELCRVQYATSQMEAAIAFFCEGIAEEMKERLDRALRRSTPSPFVIPVEEERPIVVHPGDNFNNPTITT